MKLRPGKRKGGQARSYGPISRIPVPVEASSLPPMPAVESALVPSSDSVTPIDFVTSTLVEPANEPAKPSWYLPPDSKVRAIALQAIAMRIAGMEDDVIAKSLGISKGSISPYIYRAGKNGWLDIDNPNLRLEYAVMHKVVRNLDLGLDATGRMANGLAEKTHIALEIAKGTMFKRYDEMPQGAQQNTMVAIHIEMPAGTPQVVREGTVGGTPAFLKGAVDAVLSE